MRLFVPPGQYVVAAAVQIYYALKLVIRDVATPPWGNPIHKTRDTYPYMDICEEYKILSRQYEKTHAPYCPFRPKNLKTYC